MTTKGPEGVTRRDLIRATAALGLVGCFGKHVEPVCTDTSNLSKEEVDARVLLGYVDRTPDPWKSCAKCTQFKQPARGGECGGCGAFKGPVASMGSCKIFALRA